MNDDYNYDEFYGFSSGKKLASKTVDCYFSDEYLEDFIEGRLNKESKVLVKKHISDCPYCSYDYENLCHFSNSKTKNDMKIQISLIRAKCCEFIITFFVAALFIGSLLYFFVKIHAFSKVEKKIPQQEITQDEGITFEL